MRIALIVAALLLVTGCRSTTVIRSSDPDARIYVNGEYYGTGRAVYSDQKVAFSNNKVQIRKEGCQTEHYNFRRSEEADVGAIVGGILFTFPFLWITEYKHHRAYEFQCVSSGA